MNLTEEEKQDFYSVNLDTGESLSLSVNDILVNRGNRYGSFADHAAISQQLQQTFYRHLTNRDNVPNLPPYMIESLNMIFHKLARIANGDPFYIDGWMDLCGYSQLVVDILRKTDGATDAEIKYVTRKNGSWS